MEETPKKAFFDTNKIRECFPLPHFRPGQEQAIERIAESFNEGYDVVLLEGPTGSGKSAIGYTVAQLANYSYYLCPQKFLQDQLTTDFGESGRALGGRDPMIDLKGRGTYPCTYYSRILNAIDENDARYPRFYEKSQKAVFCDRGECKKDGKSKLPFCFDGGTHCPYFERVYKALAARICLMNFHAFLFQTNVVRQFPPRDLLIIDETHVAEDVLLSFVELKISDRQLARQRIRFPEFQTVEEYLDFFEEIELGRIITEEIKVATLTGQVKEESEWTHLAIKYRMLRESNPENWIVIFEESKEKTSRTVTLKPIFIDEFAHKYLLNKAPKKLLMSATILSKEVICDSLGLKKDDTKMLRLPCLFPAENRKIFYRPSGSMSFRNKKDTFPRLISDVDKLCRKHEGEHGIIHTHNFEICTRILDGVSPETKQRLLFQRDFNTKHALVQMHKSRTDSIIIAPAMHEGLDLVDDLGRFQLLCKVPYPSTADPQIKARMEISRSYYDWRTATKLVQSYGRIIRNKRDYGTTYVLDEDFRKFALRVKQMLPPWFWEALVWEAQA